MGKRKRKPAAKLPILNSLGNNSYNCHDKKMKDSIKAMNKTKIDDQVIFYQTYLSDDEGEDIQNYQLMEEQNTSSSK